MSKSSLFLSLALGAAVMAGGCATTNSSGTDGYYQPAPSSQAATVHVRNNNWSDMDVYAVRSGVKIRLGTVTSMDEADLKIPASFLAGAANVRLMLDPIGSIYPYMTQQIMVNPGQQVDLRIENNLDLTSYSVW